MLLGKDKGIVGLNRAEPSILLNVSLIELLHLDHICKNIKKKTFDILDILDKLDIHSFWILNTHLNQSHIHFTCIT